ncbi:unnamed protein product [Urochloa decumbens]|uniref:DUF295 domain-containing protein n=1 Tax=Urochloa decumbens TaxID=240449 RepID=A0ABC9G6M7_9POAL
MAYRRLVAPNFNDDDALAAAKPLRRRSSFFLSTARREIHGDALHRTDPLPPTLHGFFFPGDGSDDSDEEDDDLPPKKQGQFATLLANSPAAAAPLVVVDPTFAFLTGALPGGDYIYLLDSRNGLLLFGHLRDAATTLETGFIVCNPATEQWVEVPSCGRVDERRSRSPLVIHAYLLFDPAASSHFHVVLFWQDPVAADGAVVTTTAQAYSSETRAWISEADWSEEARSDPLESWRFRHVDNDYMYHIGYESPGEMVDGKLYLIYKRKWILEVDAQAKTRAVIPAPGVVQHEVLDYFSNSVLFVGESQGRLHCVVQEGHDELVQVLPSAQQMGPDGVEWINDGVSVWVLQDRDAQEWVLKGRVSYMQLFGRRSCNAYLEYEVAAVHPDRNLVFFVKHRDGRMVSYDTDRQEVRAVDADFGYGFGVTPYVPYLSELFLGVISAHKK